MSDSAQGAVSQASEASPRFMANLEALARRFPELAALVAVSAPAPLAIAQAASGEPSARSPGGTWLHSSRDPRSEARRIAEAARRSGEDTAVLLGFGLGYLAEALLGYEALAAEGGVALRDNQALVPGGPSRAFERVLACEADPGALRAALEARDLRVLLSDEALGFVVGGECEALVTALELSGGEKAAILELKAAEESDPAWFEGARQAAERWNAKGAVNANTLRRFGRLWVRNLSRNLAPAASAAGIERLEGLFAGDAEASPIPALVLAAGPSLDLALPYARELSRRALLVCVDTALRSLLRIGLEPDFLVLVDPQYWNWRHVAGLSAPGSFLVSEVAAWPALFRSRFRGSFLGGTLFPLGRRVEAFIGRRGMLGAGGSVATSAWDLCRIMGCSPVWMAGLDLGFPEGRTHARASLFEQRSLCEASRLAPASSSQASALVGGTSFEALAMDGGRLRTDQRMSLYAWWFESRFVRPHSPPTLSLSPKGLAVPGLSLGAIEELPRRPRPSGPDRGKARAGRGHGSRGRGCGRGWGRSRTAGPGARRTALPARLYRRDSGEGQGYGSGGKASLRFRPRLRSLPRAPGPGRRRAPRNPGPRCRWLPPALPRGDRRGSRARPRRKPGSVRDSLCQTGGVGEIPYRGPPPIGFGAK